MKSTSSDIMGLPPPAYRDGVLTQLFACQPACGHGVDFGPVVLPGLPWRKLGDRHVQKDVYLGAALGVRSRFGQRFERDEVPATVAEAALQGVADRDVLRRTLLLRRPLPLPARHLHPPEQASARAD